MRIQIRERKDRGALYFKGKLPLDKREREGKGDHSSTA